MFSWIIERNVAAVPAALSPRGHEALQCRSNSAGRSRGQLGLGKLTMIVFGLLLAAIVYSGYQIIPFFYSYFEMHNQMTAIIPKAYILKDAEIRRRIMGFIKELEIPADAKQLLIDRRDGKMRLRLSYEEVFYIPWQDEDIELYVFPFTIDVEGAY